MTYKQLQRFINKHIDINDAPKNIEEIAKDLGIKLITASENFSRTQKQVMCIGNRAFFELAWEKPHIAQAVICYEPNSPHQTFNIATMIVTALYFHHHADILPYDMAQIGAIMMLAPLHIIEADGIKTAEELALKFKIPFEAATNYWVAVLPDSPSYR